MRPPFAHLHLFLRISRNCNVSQGTATKLKGLNELNGNGIVGSVTITTSAVGAEYSKASTQQHSKYVGSNLERRIVGSFTAKMKQLIDMTQSLNNIMLCICIKTDRLAGIVDWSRYRGTCNSITKRIMICDCAQSQHKSWEVSLQDSKSTDEISEPMTDYLRLCHGLSVQSKIMPWCRRVSETSLECPEFRDAVGYTQRMSRDVTRSDIQIHCIR